MIRRALLSDLDNVYDLYSIQSTDISQINNSEYSAQVQTNGFIVPLESKESIKDQIQNHFLFNVYESDGEITGFIDFNKEIYFPEEADNIIWLDKKLKDVYFHDDSSIALHEIVVNKEHRGKGVGRKLLENAISELSSRKYQHIFSIVALSPLTNCPSIIFHTKNKFERVCVTMPINLFGLENYQSLLFYKKI